ncbi:CAP domain-containing protein [Bacillus carboniphilus]|uniref:CAP domain-containing protein n=1 Tax=Bacillus carboniphilus TaxID=86663 RepID=A0ABY9JXZ0_9BACI|nr:CAP domain-containing protein [Bacillus carboniphilus]WLR43649.1 CAP domain-containing protein [Bacillus carboniphilus]
MKVIIKNVFVPLLLAVTLFLAMSFFDFPTQFETEKPPIENVPLSEGEENKQMENKIEIGQESLLTLIGQTSNQVIEQYGDPLRIDPSMYGYEWWIYPQDEENYFQVGVRDQKVVTLFAIGPTLNISPLKPNSLIEEIEKNQTVSDTVELEEEGSRYQFSLSDEDLKVRPLLSIEDTFVQLYIDSNTKRVSSIRVLDGPTLIKHKPYNLTYRGTLLPEHKVEQDDWPYIQEGLKKQIFDVTNVIRARHNKMELLWDLEVSEMADRHSKDMSDHNFFAHQSPNSGSLLDRLTVSKIPFQIAGENIAAHYVDGLAAVEGWMNSSSHRETLLNDEYTHLGVGVHEKYYTQNFIKQIDFSSISE